jgi:membrane associated rhomboid family serine protease
LKVVDGPTVRTFIKTPPIFVSPAGTHLGTGSGVWFLVLSCVLIGFASYIMTPEERARTLAGLRTAARRFAENALGGAMTRPFGKVLSERTPWPVVTPILATSCVLVFLAIAFGAGSPSGNEGWIAWGGNVGPLTTNGEWYRLITSVFVHPHLLDLLATLAGLAAFGLIAERLVGSAAFATVCLASAVTANLVSLTAEPLRLSVGASGAVLGIYGLLIATAVRVFIATRAPLIPWEVAKPLAPVAAVFFLYTFAAPSMAVEPELAALFAGTVSGFVLSKGIQHGKPKLRPVRRVVMTTAAVALLSAVMLAGIDDGRLEVAAVTALEERTARQYETAVDKYRAGGVSADNLIQMIEATIVPELQAAQGRLQLLDRVPDEQKPSLDHTDRYLRQRQESWRLRVDGLRQRAILEARQAGKRQQAASPLSTKQLLQMASISLESAEGAERSAIRDLRAAAVILQ